MTSKEQAKNLIDSIPESRMPVVLAYLQGAAVPDDETAGAKAYSSTGSGAARNTSYSGANRNYEAEKKFREAAEELFGKFDPESIIKDIRNFFDDTLR